MVEDQSPHHRRRFVPYLVELHFAEFVAVSMVDGDLFDKIARVGSIIRRHPDPFGAIQVVTLMTSFNYPD